MTISVVDATWPHVVSVLDDIRPADMQEWYAGTGMLFAPAVLGALDRGEYSRVALDESGVPLCFWGCDESLDGGRVWLFATNSAERRALSLHKVLRPNLADILRRWPNLEAFADDRNKLHHRWLEWLGFSLETTIFLDPLGMPFRKYVLETRPCA